MIDVTRILSAIDQGDPSAAGQLLPLVYDELHTLAAQKMAQEAPGHTLQATALAHEACIREQPEQPSGGPKLPPTGRQEFRCPGGRIPMGPQYGSRSVAAASFGYPYIYGGRFCWLGVVVM